MGNDARRKIPLRKIGLVHVTPGQIVDAYPDLVMSHTATWRPSALWRRSAQKLFMTRTASPSLDHIAPAKSEECGASREVPRLRKAIRDPVL